MAVAMAVVAVVSVVVAAAAAEVAAVAMVVAVPVAVAAVHAAVARVLQGRSNESDSTTASSSGKGRAWVVAIRLLCTLRASVEPAWNLKGTYMT